MQCSTESWDHEYSRKASSAPSAHVEQRGVSNDVDNGISRGVSACSHQVPPLRPGELAITRSTGDSLPVVQESHSVGQCRKASVPVSTKITVAHASEPVNFHLYRECGDGENLYLEIHNGNSVFSVSFPIGVGIGAARRLLLLEAALKRCANASDNDIRCQVQSEVDLRIENTEDPLLELQGLLVYGASKETPRDEQMERGISTYTEDRNRCVEILQLADDVEKGRV